MTEREELEKAISALESQRDVLGDSAVEAALGGLKSRLANLETVTGSRPSKEREIGWIDERKLVTILFADLSGFTALSEKTDPEVVRELVNTCFSQLVPVIQKYGGTVEKYIGDEIMALFGAPIAHENDAERAVLVAMEMMDLITQFNVGQGVDLGIHIGVNTGAVVAGGIGSQDQQQYSVTGDAVNLAARLTEAARRGQIFVGANTYQLTVSRFDYEAIPPMHLKGKADPVQVYRLIGLKQKPERARGLESHGISSPLVGRALEYDQLYTCFERLLDKQGGLAIVYGEAGVGKTRLLAEVHHHLPQDQLLWMEGSLLAYGQSLSYWPFQEIIRRYADINEEDSESETWKKLEIKLDHLFLGNQDEVTPYIGSLLNLQVPEKYRERVRYLDGEAMGKQIFLATRRLFEHLAADKPLALVFDDLHWIDASSEGLLEHILGLIPQVPILIVGLSRPGSQIPAPRLVQAAASIDPHRCQEIHLSRLTDQESHALLKNLLQWEDLSSLAAPVIAKAEGNPFFLEEVIRALIDEQVVVHDPAGGVWKIAERLDVIAIPDTLQGLISARLDRLDEEVKQVLRFASVIGRSFLYRLLLEVSMDIQQFDDKLRLLEEIELIAEKQRIPELEYMFKHALTQEVTYESILLQKRRQLHARVAEAIELLFPDRVEEFYSLLAYHYAKAESWEKALDFLIKAGDQANRIAADAEALEYYRQAMAAYGRMSGDRWDPHQQAMLEHNIGEALYRRGDHAEALKYLKSASSHLGYPVSDSRGEIRRTALFGMLKQLIRRLLGIRYNPGLSQPNPEMIEEAYRIYYLIGWITAFFDQEYYAYMTIKSLELGEHHFHPILGSGLASLGLIFDFLPAYRLADGFHRFAMEIAQNPTQDVQYSIGYTYICLSLHEALAGKFDPSLDYGWKARQVYWDAGDIRGWGLSSETVGQDLIYQGNFPLALEVAESLLELGVEVGDTELKCWGLMIKGTTEYYLGHLDDAHAHLSQSAQLSRQVPDYYSLLFTGGMLGQCLLSQGDFEPALAVLEESWQISKQYKMRGNALTPAYHGLMQAYLLKAEQADPPLKGDWLQKAGALSRDVRVQARAFRGGLPEALLLEARLEWLKGKRAKARRLWERSLKEAEHMGMRHMLGTAYREIGQHLGDKEYLDRAETILSELLVPPRPST